MTRPRAALAICLCVAAPFISADDSGPAEGQAPVHWAFATLLGTGWYKVNNSRSLFVLRIPPRITLRESGFDDDGVRRIGVDLRLSVTVGFHNIDDIQGLLEDANFGSLAFTPGVDVEIPVTEQFYLRPFANIGWGTELGENNSAWIYQAGVKSRYTFEAGGKPLALIGNIYYAGYTPNRGASDDLSGIALGIEGRLPFKDFTMGGKPMAFDWHAMYTYFSNEPVFTRPNAEPAIVEQLIEVGVALSPRNGRWNFWVWKPERLGVAYKFDPNGNFSAITINFTSWFRR